MEIKNELVLNGMTWAAADDIEYNIIRAFKTRDSNMPGYYTVRWTGNSYTLQEKYTCHAFDPPVIIPEGEMFCPAKFMTPMRNNSYWYKDPDEAIPDMVKLKQSVIPYIEFIRDNNITNKLPSRFKGYADMNPHLLSEYDHKILFDKIIAKEILTMMNMWKMKITTM